MFAIKFKPFMPFVCTMLCCAGPVGAETEPQNIHEAANLCMSQTCETRECQTECNTICDFCHGFGDSSGTSGATPVSGSEPDSTGEVATTSKLLKDKCMDCHQDHHSGDDHPVEVVYPTLPPEDYYVLTPKGVYLVCVDEGECRISCVSCHAVHPSASDGQDVEHFLRVENERSQLCFRCHII